MTEDPADPDDAASDQPRYRLRLQILGCTMEPRYHYWWEFEDSKTRSCQAVPADAGRATPPRIHEAESR